MKNGLTKIIGKKQKQSFRYFSLALIAVMLVASIVSIVIASAPATVTDNFNDSSKIASSANVTVASGVVTLSASGSWTCGDTLVDSRDAKTYTTVLIGSQCWMRQNINVGTLTAGSGNQGTSCSSIQKYCYSDTESNCTTYGGLYQWGQAMCGSTTPPIIGICPTGWHIPTDIEYMTLEEYLGMCSGGGAGCSGATGWRGTTQGTNMKTVDSTHFSGLLAGYRYTNGLFGTVTSNALFWSSVQASGSAWYRYLNSGAATVYRDTIDKAHGFSVRCLKD